MASRRFRIRSKHYEYLLIALVVAGAAVIGAAFFKHKQKGVASRVPASVQPEQQQKIADTYFANARKLLGESQQGKLAFLFLIRGMDPSAKNKNPNLAKVCLSNANCNLNVTNVYRYGIGKLTLAKDYIGCLGLQRDLVSSQLSNEDKLDVLAGFLVSPEGKNRAPSSVSNDGKIKLSREAEYRIFTLGQFESLKPKPEQMVKVVLKVAQNSHDRLAQEVLLNGISKTYPQFSSLIASTSKQLGIKLTANTKK